MLPLTLHGLALHVLSLLLLKNALKDAIAADLVHVKNFVSYDSLDAFGRQVVNHVPV